MAITDEPYQRIQLAASEIRCRPRWRVVRWGSRYPINPSSISNTGVTRALIVFPAWWVIEKNRIGMIESNARRTPIIVSIDPQVKWRILYLDYAMYPRTVGSISRS